MGYEPREGTSVMNKLSSNCVRRLAGLAIVGSMCFGAGVPIATSVVTGGTTAAAAVHPATDCPAGEQWNSTTDSCVAD
jgi:hypothetical protein